MKNKIIFFILSLISVSVFSQVPPEAFNYSSVIRGNNGQALPNRLVSLRLTILSGSPSGTSIYQESHIDTTSQLGVINLEIGRGDVLYGNFSTINWGSNNFYLQIELDDNGGSSFVMMGTVQFLSVPYALHAKTAENVSSTNSDKFYLGQDTLGGIVYYIYKDSSGIQHGLIVAKTESVAQWQSISTFVNANRTDDGDYNTALMVNSPAATYVNGFGSEWYLPSIDELTLLYLNRFTTNRALRTNGSTILSFTTSTVYWSSTELNTSNAMYFHFHQCSSASNGKSTTYSVRAIRKF